MMKPLVMLPLLCLLFVSAPERLLASELPLARLLASLETADAPAVGNSPLLSVPLLARFYESRDYAWAWTDAARILALHGVVTASRREGLTPEDFHLDAVTAATHVPTLDGLAESDRLAMELLLSDALLRYVHHTRFGKLDPEQINPEWNDRGPVPAEPLLADMTGAIAAEDLTAFLEERFEPPFWYQELRKALEAYLDLAHLEDLMPIPGGGHLAYGSQGPRVAMLRERLQQLGHHPEEPAANLEYFDEGLKGAVMALQQRFGLGADGIVGPKTLELVNAPYDADRVALLRINLERMRWLYNDLPADYIFVDVANYMGYLIRDGQIAWSTRVIVGSREDQTPMFRDAMDHLVFNPTWTVPVSIQKKMGKVSASYTLVDRRTGRKQQGGNAGDYKRYRVVQKPGPKNALGRVKFMFPNHHAVYLHDTASRGLFARRQRALSHGCVRVQDPLRLAELILGPEGWSRSNLDRMVDRGQTRYVTLKQELPVLLYYLTARATDRGGIHIRADIYDRDAALLKAIDQPVSSVRLSLPEPPPVDQDGFSAAEPGDGEVPGQQGQPSKGEDQTPPEKSERETLPQQPMAPPQHHEGVRLTQQEP